MNIQKKILNDTQPLISINCDKMQVYLETLKYENAKMRIVLDGILTVLIEHGKYDEESKETVVNYLNSIKEELVGIPTLSEAILNDIGCGNSISKGR